MRAALGPWLAHVALMGAGFGVLTVTGQLRSSAPLRILAAAGLAYMAGVATVITTIILLLTVGVSLSFPLFVLLCAGFAAPTVLLIVRRPPRLRRPALPSRAQLRALGLERWVVIASVTGLAVLAVVGAAALYDRPLAEFDAWQIWTRKAVLLFYNPTLPRQMVANRIYGNANWDYPLGLPMLEAMQFRAGGRPVPEQAHVVPWLLLSGFVWAGAYLVRRSVRALVWTAVLGGLAVLSVAQVSTAYADVPLACFLGLAALALGLWIEGGRTSDLAIGAVLVAGAAGMKNEGIGGAALVLAVAVAVQVASRDWRRTGMTAAASVAVLALAVLPWRLWLAAHDIAAGSSTPLGKGLSPSFLAGRTERVGPSIDAIYTQVTGLPTARLVVPIALALLVLRLRAVPRVAAFYLAVGLLYFASLVWAYWISPLDLTFLISTSVSRIHAGLVFIAAAAALQLSAIGAEPVAREERAELIAAPPRTARSA